MLSPRFFCPDNLAPGAVISLPDGAAHHACKVLRLNAGSQIVLFNGDGNNYPAILTHLSKKGVCAKITECHPAACESPLNVTLAQAISSGDRMDFTLQKAVELGVNQIQPLATERSIVKLSDERATKRHLHWQNVVIAACEQCGRAVVPTVHVSTTLSCWLETLPEYALKIMLSPTAHQTLHDVPPPRGAICLLVGCEGGFTPHEMLAAQNKGFLQIRLGTRVLRTESAALAALAAMQALWGDF
ncbi:MAG: 16S rRNA (uracil(1498)-N(3))-methyltransferase [Methylophilaceae bacterium]|nr:16S rRNA (uracil(1498)-N(3))-methyltransferase [Methylophilaceae bacterium]